MEFSFASLRRIYRKEVSLFLLVGVIVLTPPYSIAQRQAEEFKTKMVKTPDGVSVSVQEWGNPDGPEILFIHGFSQSHLCWLKQVRSDLTKTFRIITYDLRGHGGSDKPLDSAYYKESKRWAGELQTVIDFHKLKKPFLCAWSYGGRIVLDYLTYYSQEKLSGINFISAITKSGPNVFGPAVRHLFKMSSDEIKESKQATVDFLREITSKPLPKDEFEFMLAYNTVCPPRIRANMGGRPADYEKVLSRIVIPVLVTHGKKDAVVLLSMAEHTAKVIKGAKVSYYDDIGHMPFWEDPERFNRELAEFVKMFVVYR